MEKLPPNPSNEITVSSRNHEPDGYSVLGGYGGVVMSDGL
jgi:hypothetical protein